MADMPYPPRRSLDPQRPIFLATSLSALFLCAFFPCVKQATPSPSQTSTNKHKQAQASTSKHKQAQASTSKHKQAQPIRKHIPIHHYAPLYRINTHPSASPLSSLLPPPSSLLPLPLPLPSIDSSSIHSAMHINTPRKTERQREYQGHLNR